MKMACAFNTKLGTDILYGMRSEGQGHVVIRCAGVGMQVDMTHCVSRCLSLRVCHRNSSSCDDR